MFEKHKVKAIFKGFSVCPLFDFEDSFKNCYKNGVSLYNVPYVNYSHKKKDIQEALRGIESGIKETKGKLK
jgi:hypothetical protein